MSFNLAVVLRESARSHPGKVALASQDGTLTYAELDRASDAVAANLVADGLLPGDAVGLQLPNVPEFAVALYGILKAGGVAVPMNVLNKGPEVGFFLSNSGARAHIVAAACAADGASGAELSGVERVYVVGEPPADSPVRLRSFDQLLVPHTGRAPYVQRDPGATAILLYTSGTTGKPKGVELTHFQLYMNADAHVESFSMSSDSVVIAVMPLFHALGLSGILNATLATAGTVVLVQRFEPVAVLSAVQEHGATLLHGVPTIYHALLNHPQLGAFDLGTLRFCGSAGAPIASELLDDLERTLGVVIIEMYGLTESGPLATANLPGDRKPYSIGKPIRGVEVEIWDAAGNQLPRGREHVGEIVIRGHNTMGGYLGNPEATEEAFTGGFLHTGDLGYQDEDGFFFIVDRKKEMIIRGGYNVYPREVENVLYTHPGVDEVAVVGIPDQRLGEEIKAFVSARPGSTLTPEDVIAYAKARVAAYKYPRHVEVLPTLPKSPTGKILKKELVTS